MSTYILRKGVAQLSDLADGGGVHGYPGEGYTGEVYYVNNITGSSGNSGLTWGDAMDQVSTAITASETQRALQSGTTNDYVRNIIYVQGTGTAYTKLTALPLHCDIVGLGADPRGTGSGIARIGADSGDTDGVVSTSTVRGLNVYNIQFQAGNDKYCFSSTSMFRSRFENCAFMTNGAPSGTPTAGFYSTTALGGVVFKDCHFGSSSSVHTEPDISFKIAGTNFHNCLVKDCFIVGTTGVTIASTVVTSYGSMFKNNFMGNGSQTMGICVNDDATTSGGFFTMYVNNWVMASGIAFDVEQNGPARVIGNYKANALIAANA